MTKYSDASFQAKKKVYSLAFNKAKRTIRLPVIYFAAQFVFLSLAPYKTREVRFIISPWTFFLPVFSLTPCTFGSLKDPWPRKHVTSISLRCVYIAPVNWPARVFYWVIKAKLAYTVIKVKEVGGVDVRRRGLGENVNTLSWKHHPSRMIFCFFVRFQGCHFHFAQVCWIIVCQNFFLFPLDVFNSSRYSL